jgi:hypothetical protein
MHTNALNLAVVIVLTSITHGAAAQEAWPSLPKGELEFKNLGDKYARSVKTESIQISRNGNRIAQVTKIDRNSDGKFEEFIFSALVAGQRVFVLSRLGGTNESSQFYSYDDTMVMNDMRFPETNLTALLIASKKHGYYEIFTRHSDGYYWPADDQNRKVVDSFFRANAEAVAPHLKKLEK